jgi:hypothetical protein
VFSISSLPRHSQAASPIYFDLGLAIPRDKIKVVLEAFEGFTNHFCGLSSPEGEGATYTNDGL